MALEFIHRAAAVAAVSCLSLPAWAPAAAAAPRADPSDPQTPVPALLIRSPLRGVPLVADSAPRSWREANEHVARIGGWRSYLRQAQAEPAASAPPPAARP